MDPWVTSMLVGAVGGAGYAVWQYLDQAYNPNNPKPESFQLPKFGRTVAIGLVIGAVAQWQGWTLAYATDYATALPFFAVASGVVEDTIKRILQKFGWL